jgi:hypothetical protein
MMIGGSGSSNLTGAILAGKQIGNTRKAIREQAASRRQQLGLGIGALGLNAIGVGTDLYGTIGSLSEAAKRREQSGTEFTQDQALRKELFGQSLAQRDKESLRASQEAQAARDLQAKLAAQGLQERTDRDRWIADRDRIQTAMDLQREKDAERRKAAAALDARAAERAGRPIAAAQALRENMAAARGLGGIENEQLAARVAITGSEAERQAKAGHWRNMEIQTLQDEAAAERQKELLGRTAPYVYNKEGQKYPWALAQAIMEEKDRQQSRALQAQMPGIQATAQTGAAKDVATFQNQLPLGRADREAAGLRHGQAVDLQTRGFGQESAMIDKQNAARKTFADWLNSQPMSVADRQKLEIAFENELAGQAQQHGQALERITAGGEQDIRKLKVAHEFEPSPWEKSDSYISEMVTRREEINNQYLSGLISKEERDRQVYDLEKQGSVGYTPAEAVTSSISGLEQGLGAGALSPEKLKGDPAYLVALERMLDTVPEQQQGPAWQEMIRRRGLAGKGMYPQVEQGPMQVLNYARLASILNKLGR